MQIVFGYLQIGEIITDPAKIIKYNWHPHADKSKLDISTNALYIPRDTLSFDSKKPGYGTLNFEIKRVLTKKGCTPGIWEEKPFLKPDMVIGNRKNSATNGGLYYQGQWQELVLKESKAAEEWAMKVIS
jgi:hypothetical protein